MSDWQWIDTVPLNEMVLGFFPDADVEIMICILLVSDDPEDTPDWYEQCEKASAPLDVQPSHWMPLPDVPEAHS